MEQKVLNEQQMREYIENEVRIALITEGIDEGLNEDLDEGLMGSVGDWITGMLQKKVGEGRIGRFIGEHANKEDLINLAIGIFGVGTIVKWFCQALGIDMSSPLANILVRAISGYAALRIGDKVQAMNAERAQNGLGGASSPTGGEGYSSGDEGGGSR